MAQFRENLAKARLAKCAVAFIVQIPLSALDSIMRGEANVAFGRQVAMYITYVTFSMSLCRTARAFFRDRSSVSHACHPIEDWREIESFDAWLSGLEAMLLAAPDGPTPLRRVKRRRS